MKDLKNKRSDDSDGDDSHKLIKNKDKRKLLFLILLCNNIYSRDLALINLKSWRCYSKVYQY